MLMKTQPLVTCWYIREAAIPSDLSDIIDFPQFWNFIAQHMIVRCLAKEIGNPRLTTEQATLDVMREQVVSTLADQVPDQDDTIEMDSSFYEDSGIGMGTGTGDY